MEITSERVKAALLMVGILLAMGLAGSMDYEDRARDLGASMVPDPEWQQAAG